MNREVEMKIQMDKWYRYKCSRCGDEVETTHRPTPDALCFACQHSDGIEAAEDG